MNDVGAKMHPPAQFRQRKFAGEIDRKSTRLNSSHANISYAVFCLKKNTYRVGRSRQMGAQKLAKAARRQQVASESVTAGPARFVVFLNDTATAEISPLSLHDALPI